MNITQSYKQGNHVPYWKNATKGRAEYPTDNAGMDSGRDFFRAPCDCKITYIDARNSKNWTNKMILVSTKKVETPGYGVKQIYFKIVHFLYSDVKDYGLKKGKKFKQGEVICAEGKDNYSTGNHIHMTQGIGYASKNVSNGNGKLSANGDGKYPENIFFIDRSYTKKIINDGGLKWKKIN